MKQKTIKSMAPVALLVAVGMAVTFGFGISARAQTTTPSDTSTPTTLDMGGPGSVMPSTDTTTTTAAAAPTPTTSTTAPASTTPTPTVNSSTPTTITTPSTTTPSSTVAPSVTAEPVVSLASGYLQIEGLTVASTSAAGTMPMQILATVPASGATCEQFASGSATTGTSIACPVAASMTVPTSSTSSPAYYNPYVIVVDAATQLLTRDRASATFAEIMPGDTINAYGYYDGVNTLDAGIVRDLSQPATASTTLGTGTAGAAAGSTSTTIASLRAQLDRLETLVIQLEAEIGMSTTTSAMTTVPTTTLPASCPMIPAGATSTAGCSPAITSSSPSSSLNSTTPPLYE